MKRIVTVLGLLVLFAAPLSAQEKLSNYNTTWDAVLPGTPLCEPAVTSYGFCIATDARNIMGFSSNGTLLWEKQTGRIRNLSLTALTGDFVLFHDKTNNILKLFNPSGSEIWSKALDFSLYGNPLPGRDGRFFVYGENKVACYGINGVCRWSQETAKQKKLAAQELPDGSIIIFLEDKGGQTHGLRISPFGEQLENIIFAGSVTATWTCNEGVLLAFSDGSAGLFSIKDGLSVNRWVAKVENARGGAGAVSAYVEGAAAFVVRQDGSQFALLSLAGSGVTVYKLDCETGNSIQSKKLPNLKGTELQNAYYSPSGIFLCDKNNAILLGNELNELWSAKMPDSVRNQKTSYVGYIEQDYLVIFDKNWSINAYHTAQTTSKSKNAKASVQKNIQSDYSSFVPLELSEFNYYNQGSFFNSVKDPSIAEQILNGNYGTKEQQWLIQTLSVARLYSLDATSSDFGIHTEKSVFQTDSAGFETILIQLALLGTEQTQNAAADIISKSRNKSYCKVLMANLNGYDPEGKLLAALERNAELAGNKDSDYCRVICDAVYSVCLFMGRPAYNKKGREIIKKFMGIGYTSNVRNYARDTLKKIISLEL